MKKKYYLFQMDDEITKCSQCPMCDINAIRFWCMEQRREIQYGTLATPKSSKCRLVKIEGKVEQ